MPLHSHNVSAMALLSSSFMSELFPVGFSCSKFFILSQSSLGFYG